MNPTESNLAADVLLDRKPEYLINAMEAAAQHENPHSVGYGEKRGAVFGYIGKLQRENARLRAALVRAQDTIGSALLKFKSEDQDAFAIDAQEAWDIIRKELGRA